MVVVGDDTYSENIAAHQLESKAYEQANELMRNGVWGDIYTNTDGDVTHNTWLKNDQFVSVEEWELRY